LTSKDLLDWTKINKKIEISYTKKKFFNEFYFRLNYHVPGARLVAYSSYDHGILKVRVQNYNNNDWRVGLFHRVPADYQQLEDFSEIYQNKNNISNGRIKFRIESDTFSIYSDQEQTLFDIASGTLKKWKSDLKSISLIENLSDFDLLDQGHIIVKKTQTHPYRVKIKETFNYLDEKQSLLTYLKNLGEHVRVTKYMFERLESDHKYFPGGHIHLDDSRLIDMLRLIAPNLIGSVNQLVTQ